MRCAWLGWAAAFALVAFMLAPLGWGGADGQDLLGEVWINSSQDAYDTAELMLAEAREIWDSPAASWRVVSTSGGVTVEARAVTRGDLARSRVLLTRAEGFVANASARAVIKFLASPAGFATIDPMSDPADFEKHLERYAGWRGGGSGAESGERRLEVAEAKAPLPRPFLAREFVVLNAIDLGARVFASKSVLHASRPGGSEFNAAGAPPPPGKVRALNTFAVTTEPADGGCVVRAINYAHLGGRFSTALMNWINCKAFVAPVYERLQQAMNERAARVLGKILKERVDPKSDAERAFPL